MNPEGGKNLTPERARNGGYLYKKAILILEAPNFFFWGGASFGPFPGL